MKVVRSKAGLAYSIGSVFKVGKFPGAFIVVLETKNASANQAIKLILTELHDIQQKPVTDTELNMRSSTWWGAFR